MKIFTLRSMRFIGWSPKSGPVKTGWTQDQSHHPRSWHSVPGEWKECFALVRFFPPHTTCGGVLISPVIFGPKPLDSFCLFKRWFVVRMSSWVSLGVRISHGMKHHPSTKIIKFDRSKRKKPLSHMMKSWLVNPPVTLPQKKKVRPWKWMTGILVFWRYVSFGCKQGSKIHHVTQTTRASFFLHGLILGQKWQTFNRIRSRAKTNKTQEIRH